MDLAFGNFFLTKFRHRFSFEISTNITNCKLTSSNFNSIFSFIKPNNLPQRIKQKLTEKLEHRNTINRKQTKGNHKLAIKVFKVKIKEGKAEALVQSSSGEVLGIPDKKRESKWWFIEDRELFKKKTTQECYSFPYLFIGQEPDQLKI